MCSVLQSAIPLSLLVFAAWGQAAQQINVAAPAKGIAELPVIVAMRNGYSELKDWRFKRFRSSRILR